MLKKIIISSTILIVLTIILVIFNTCMNTIILGITINLITALIGYTFGIVAEYYNDIKLILVCYLKYYKKNIRVSVSYLYRIKVDGKYLLVKSNRIPGQYQPVGGVYKKYDTSNKYLDELNVKDDNGFSMDKDNKDDLRLRVPSENLYKFIKWFENREDRELDPIREFYEELVSVGVLPKEVFHYFSYRFIRQIRNSIKYSEHFKCNEMLISNIYELLPTADQLIELKKLLGNESTYYRWFTCEEIECLGHTTNSEYRVSPTAKWTL
ncbi:hypothetical protein ACN077_24600 [Clostridium chromiireducens]|uniref:SMODS-associated NUDIX domain-containing protein n=1 Tax=Clostridium chromiireducens TaxID=225345 RepID=UPI003AF98539